MSWTAARVLLLGFLFGCCDPPFCAGDAVMAKMGKLVAPAACHTFLLWWLVFPSSGTTQPGYDVIFVSQNVRAARNLILFARQSRAKANFNFVLTSPHINSFFLPKTVPVGPLLQLLYILISPGTFIPKEIKARQEQTPFDWITYYYYN